MFIERIGAKFAEEIKCKAVETAGEQVNKVKNQYGIGDIPYFVLFEKRSKKNIAQISKLLDSKTDITDGEKSNILKCVTDDNFELAVKLCSMKVHQTHNGILGTTFCKYLGNKIDNICIHPILEVAKKENVALIGKMLDCENIDNHEIRMIMDLIEKKPYLRKTLEKILQDENFETEYLILSLNKADENNLALYENLCENELMPKNRIVHVLECVDNKSKEEIDEIIQKINEFKPADTDFGTHLYMTINNENLNAGEIKIYKNWINKVSARIRERKLVPYDEKLHGNLDELKAKGLIVRKKLNGKRTNWVEIESDKPSYRYLLTENRNGKIFDVSTKKIINTEEIAKTILGTLLGDEAKSVVKLINMFGEDGANQVLDKGLQNFLFRLQDAKELDDTTRKMITEITNNTKTINKNGEIVALSPSDKIGILELVSFNKLLSDNNKGAIDFLSYIKQIDKSTEKIFDIEAAKSKMNESMLKEAGLTAEEIQNMPPKLKWDETFSELLYSSLLGKSNPYLKIIVKYASKGEFEKLINNPRIILGHANIKTQSQFQKHGLDFKVWDSEKIPPQKINIGGNELTISLWDRNPQKSIFNGNYTTCCTGVERGDEAISTYLLNKAINVVEVRDKSGKVVAMSRIFMAEVDGKNGLVMENIEVNNALQTSYLASDGAKYQLRNEIFDFMKKLSKKVTKDESAPLYFSTNYCHVAPSDCILKKGNTTLYWKDLFETAQTRNIKMIGKISTDKIYLNTIPKVINSKKINEGEEFVAELYKI